MQTQGFCRGDFASWDDKITTLPGLYCVALVSQPALHVALRWAESVLGLMGVALPPSASTPGGAALQCSARELRLLNVVFAVLMAAVVHRILEHLHGKPEQRPDERRRHNLRIAVVLLFPIQYFFYFVFYTDAIGTLMVLCMYERCLASNVWMASLCGASSIFCRQTNVVWVVFCGGVVALRRIEQESPLNASSSAMAHVLHTARRLLSRHFFAPIVGHVAPLIFVCLGFLTFVVQNGGVAVGDKLNHQAGFHPMQPCYWMLLVLFMLWPWMLSPFRVAAFFGWLCTNRFAALCLLLLSLLGAHYFTSAHPFLLADNRHYTFYLWKNLYRRVAMARYLIAPVYIFGGWSCSHSLVRMCSPSWVCWFLLCSCIVVVPTGLLEFRYFLTQTVMLLLHQPLYSQLPSKSDIKSNSKGCRLETARGVLGGEAARVEADLMGVVFYAAVNSVTIYIFLFRSFQWPDGSVARFMW